MIQMATVDPWHQIRLDLELVIAAEKNWAIQHAKARKLPRLTGKNSSSCGRKIRNLPHNQFLEEDFYGVCVLN